MNLLELRDDTAHNWPAQPIMVEQDLDSMHRDPQEEVTNTLRDLLLLGTQLSIVLAFIRGIMHVYSTYKPVAMERKPFTTLSSQSYMWTHRHNTPVSEVSGKAHHTPMNLHEI